ncbi:MAG: cupin domain-containing protein [Denitrovibrio sp.]|nr:MAG: cupin domain-containing protein [Denitrovibrio sp.]
MPFVNMNEIKTKNIIEGAEAKMVHTDGMTLSQWSFKAGTKLPEHSHFHEQMTKLISGKFEMTVDGVTKILEKTDIVVIPPNAVHSGIAITDCELVDVFHPARDDYK